MSGARTLRILFFSSARDIAGVPEISLPCDTSISQPELRKKLIEQFDGLARVLDTARFARNHSYAAPDECFTPGDEIALIPPVSGG